MLPYRFDRYIFAAALVAGCLFASTSWSQSFDATPPDRSAQSDDISIGGKFKFGAATIDLNHISVFEKLDRQSEQSSKREETNSATFTLNLPDNGKRYLFPEVLNFSASKTDFFGQPQISIGSIADPDPYDQSKSDYMISADWGVPEDKFTFSFSSRVLGDQLYDGESVDINDDMLNLTRTLRTGNWLSSFTASVGRGYREETGNRERTQKIGASANFKTMQNKAPNLDITAKILRDRTSKPGPGGSDIDTTWEFRTGSNILGATSRDGLTTQPSLSIFFSVKGNAPDEEDVDTKSIDFSAGLAGKVHF